MFNGHKMAWKIGTIVFCINFNLFRTMCQDGIISYSTLWNSAVKYKAAQENSIFSMESHSRRFQNISQTHTTITLLKYSKVSIVVWHLYLFGCILTIILILFQHIETFWWKHTCDITAAYDKYILYEHNSSTKCTTFAWIEFSVKHEWL